MYLNKNQAYTNSSSAQSRTKNLENGRLVSVLFFNRRSPWRWHIKEILWN